MRCVAPPAPGCVFEAYSGLQLARSDGLSADERLWRAHRPRRRRFPESLFVVGRIQENQDEARVANPITYVTPDDPPMLLKHGKKDLAVPFNQSEPLYAALRQAGFESRLYKVVGGDHGFRDATKDTPEAIFAMLRVEQPYIDPEVDYERLYVARNSSR